MNNFTEYFSELNFAISKLDLSALEDAFTSAFPCRNLYIFGNGGSAAIANHWVCDYTKGINEDTKLCANAISLSSNVELISAIANDIGYEYIFSKQLEYSKADCQDTVFAISSSGNSKNFSYFNHLIMQIKSANFSFRIKIVHIHLSKFYSQFFCPRGIVTFQFI